jgi:DNA-binding IclR family transcriptional regulator
MKRPPQALSRTSQSGPARSRTHQSLERGLRVLEATAAFGGAASLADVARRTGLARSTAHHLLRALVAFGYLAQEATAQPYRLAPRLLRLAGRTWSREELSAMAQPCLAEILGRSGEGASLAMLEDGVVTIVAKQDPERAMRVVQEVGATRPLHCTAVGKALAAWLPPAELDRLLQRTAFDRKTPTTITSATAFRRELARIRRQGFAVDDEEHVEGIRCLAVPVRDHAGEVRAALCVVGPKSRIPRRRFRELRRLVARVAAGLSARLGHRVVAS